MTRPCPKCLKLAVENAVLRDNISRANKEAWQAIQDLEAKDSDLTDFEISLALAKGTPPRFMSPEAIKSMRYRRRLAARRKVTGESSPS